MITLLYGENDFALKEHLSHILKNFSDTSSIEKIDADNIKASDLINIFSGVSLFYTNRLVVLYDASSNKEVWEKLADYVDVESDTKVVLVEKNPDKRTKTFKLLQKNDLVHEFSPLDDKKLLDWLKKQAIKFEVELSSNVANMLVARIGNDQWRLYYDLQKLSHLKPVDEQTIEQNIDSTPAASSFTLIDAVLHKKPQQVRELTNILKKDEDPYFFFGLLSSQLLQLIALFTSGKKPVEVAKDLGVHPYPLQKMNTLVKDLSISESKNMANILSECDYAMKRSGVDPWVLIEQALLKLAYRKI